MKRQSNPLIGPDDAAALWRESEHVRRASTTVTCQLITPMYGGGVAAGEVDRTMPIRGSALRGQLRFWWRLLNGRGRNSKDLFREERDLWGGIGADDAKASMVGLRVACDPADGFLKRKSELVGFPNYVLILERGEDPWLLQQGYSFEVVITFDDRLASEQRRQVFECLRWWASFGGVGARTRRGLGAVKAQCEGADLQPVTCEETKSLGGWLVLGPSIGQQRAWSGAVGALGSFRQGPGVGRQSGSRGRGRSNWPEADTIRRLHTEGKVASTAGKSAFFPRAAFGLPIVFQFKDEKRLNDTLEGENHERMASPLILRPYFDGSGFRAMALLLPDWRNRISVPVKFKNSDRSGQAWPLGEDERSRLARDVTPVKAHGNDPLTAFMHHFADFTERTGAKRGRR